MKYQPCVSSSRKGSKGLSPATEVFTSTYDPLVPILGTWELPISLHIATYRTHRTHKQGFLKYLHITQGFLVVAKPEKYLQTSGQEIQETLIGPMEK